MSKLVRSDCLIWFLSADLRLQQAPACLPGSPGPGHCSAAAWGSDPQTPGSLPGPGSAAEAGRRTPRHLRQMLTLQRNQEFIMGKTQSIMVTSSINRDMYISMVMGKTFVWTNNIIAQYSGPWWEAINNDQHKQGPGSEGLTNLINHYRHSEIGSHLKESWTQTRCQSGPGRWWWSCFQQKYCSGSADTGARNINSVLMSHLNGLL